MCKNRIFGPSIITLIAVIFCLIAVRVEQAAQQDSQPDKSANKAQNPQSSGAQSSDPKSSGGVEPAKWTIMLPRKPHSSAPQPSSQPVGDVTQERKQEEK